MSIIKKPAVWLLPEGIEEQLPQEAEQIESLRRTLLDLYRTWGYRLVMTPLVEYLESLLTGTGQGLDLETFKITDQLNGRLMGVRADITAQVARIDARHAEVDVPSRYCYLARVLRTRPRSPGGNRSPLQIGAEIFGHHGLDSDLEVIRLMIETLMAAGIEHIHIDLGHIGIFREMIRASGVGRDHEAVLFDMLQRKAAPELKDYLDDMTIEDNYKRLFLALVDLNGGDEVISQARAEFGFNDSLEHCLSLLSALGSRIKSLYGDQVEVCFDLAELRGYEYHSGVVFAAYVPGRGEEIARGGRYDGIGEVFGKKRPATGFSAELETLITLGQAFSLQEPGSAIDAPMEDDPDLEEAIRRLRATGEIVIQRFNDCRQQGCRRQLIRSHQGWIVTDMNNDE